MDVSVEMGYLGAILVHPMMYQNFAPNFLRHLWQSQVQDSHGVFFRFHISRFQITTIWCQMFASFLLSI